MFTGLVLLAGLFFGTRRPRGGLSQPLLPSGDAPSSRRVESGAPDELWPVKPEDFVHPAQRLAARKKAEATGGRWALIGREGGVYGRFKTRAEAFEALQQAGYGRPKPPRGEALTVAEAEGWSR